MAKTGTYTQIASNTVGTATSSVTFSSIPQSYIDLVAIVQHKVATANTTTLTAQIGTTSVQTTAIYSETHINGNGTSATSGRDTGRTNFAFQRGTGDNNTNWVFTKIDFLDYSNTTTYKSLLYRMSDAAVELDFGVELCRSTSAIDIITFGLAGGYNFAVGTTLTLYGIEAYK